MEDRIVDCFRQGAGIPWTDFPDRDNVIWDEIKACSERALVNVTLPAVPGMVGRLQEGIDVLEVGCGTGHDLNEMARAFPASRFVGLDSSGRGTGRSQGAGPASWPHECRFHRTRTPPRWTARSCSTSSPPSTPCTTKLARTSF